MYDVLVYSLSLNRARQASSKSLRSRKQNNVASVCMQQPQWKKQQEIQVPSRKTKVKAKETTRMRVKAQALAGGRVVWRVVQLGTIFFIYFIDPQWRGGWLGKLLDACQIFSISSLYVLCNCAIVPLFLFRSGWYWCNNLNIGIMFKCRHVCIQDLVDDNTARA